MFTHGCNFRGRNNKLFQMYYSILINLTKTQFKNNFYFFISFNPFVTNKSKLSLLYTGVIDT